MSGPTATRSAPDPEVRATAPEPSGGTRPVGRFVLGALLVLLGVLWLLDAAGVSELRWRVVLPAALTLVGLALLATARRGAHGGLVAAGIVLGVLTLVFATTPIVTPLAGAGDHVERPTGLEQPLDYELGVGKLTVDLREATVPAGGAELSASVGMGELVVRLPAGVGAEVQASSGAGEVRILGASRGGIGVSATERIPGEPTIVLDLSVGMGKVEVRR